MKIHRAEPLHHYRLDEANHGFVDRLLVKAEKERPGFNRRMFEEDFAQIFNYANMHNDKLFDISSNNVRFKWRCAPLWHAFSVAAKTHHKTLGSRRRGGSQRNTHPGFIQSDALFDAQSNQARDFFTEPDFGCHR